MTLSFCGARDVLLQTREDYAGALGAFAWPHEDQFNWTIDWFDQKSEKGAE